MKFLLLLSIPILFIGCGEARLDGQKPHPKPRGTPIDVYITQKPTRPYEEIAYTRADCETMTADVRELQNQARHLGGDAVILLNADAKGDEVKAVVITYIPYTENYKPQP